MDKELYIKTAVDALGDKMPLQWHDAQGRHICILRTARGQLTQGGALRACDNAPVWFQVSVDGQQHGDGWYGFANPPVVVMRDGIIYPDALAALFEMIEQAVK